MKLFLKSAKAKTKATKTTHKNVLNMCMPSMQQRSLTTHQHRVPRRCWRVATRTPECFNNKIKMALLILIWTAIWCRRECVAAERHSNQAVYENNKSNNISNLHEQLEINAVDDNVDVEVLLGNVEVELSRVVAPIDLVDEGSLEQVLFKRDTAKATDGVSEELNATTGYEFTTLDAATTGVADTKRMMTQQITEIQTETETETTTTANDINSVATTMNSSVEINEYENVKNNGNENVERAKVVDRKIIAATTTRTAATALFAESDTATAAATPQTGEQQNIAAEGRESEKEEASAPEMQAEDGEEPVDVTAALQQQLIYEFAIKYKHIPRVTYFTCRWQSSEGSGGNTFGEQMTYLNMQTLEMMQRMYGSAAVDKMRSESDAKAKEKAKKASAPTTTTARAAPLSKAVETNTRKVRSNGNTRSKRTTTAAVTRAQTAAVLPLNNGNVTQSGKGSNRASRVTSDASAATTAAQWDILIKVVHIDQLINKRPTAANNKNGKNNRSYNWNVQRTFGGGFAAGGGYGRSAAGNAGARNAYTNANWLAQVLRDDGSRQLVVLNLACGAASRRLLEMASNKALFNATYHWLLIEDYTFNRNADIDDNVDNDRNGNNNENANCKRTSAHQYNETVDSDNNSNNNKFSEQTETQQLQESKEEMKKKQRKELTATTSITPRPKATLTAAAALTVTANNENTMEIIEKYLQKLNININTELILAKRHTRRIRDDAAQIGDNKKCAATNDDAADGGGSGSGGCCTSSDSESATNNTLQRKDYYQLYDVWNPGLQYGGQLNISEIGYFALDDGLQIALWYRRSTTITRRMDMKMARIRCLIVVTNKNHTDTLEHYLTTHYDTHVDSMNRFNFALLSNVRDLFNFSFVLSKTASWGYLKNGKFDGMIGALVRKQADIGGSPIFFRIERAKVIDYTTRTWVARPCFIFRHPPSTKKDRIVFLQPFSNMVWILLGLCGIFTICLLWLLTSVERRLEAVGVVEQLGHSTRSSSGSNMHSNATNNKQLCAIGGNDELPPPVGCRCSTRMPLSAGTMPSCGACNAPSVGLATKEQRKQKLEKLMQRRGKTEARRKNVHGISCRRCMLGCGSACCGQTGSVAAQQRTGLFFESVLFYVGSICQQGLTFSTSFFSGRCIVITSLLFAFAIYQFYSASIVGTLLMEKPKTIRTLRDLIHSSLAVGVEDIPYNRDYFLRTKDPIAIELYAKKVTSVPTDNEALSETTADNVTTLSPLQPGVELTAAEKAKTYREILHSHETGAHAKTNEASNWYEPEYGVKRIRKGKFAFHVDVATAYKIIADTFSEKEICELTEIQLFPPQKMVAIVQKGSPLRKTITYGLRRVTESGLMDYQRKVWHSPKPRCVKQIHTDDLRVDLQTFASALLVLIFGYAVSLLALSIEIIQHKLWQRYRAEQEDEEENE
uniref:Ionotropic receptor n=1 Tax=Zeugodacus tau TaxID=137263 RepID=A0A6M9TZK7_ZEUTA|nr:ionotropic receptor [Zeugodacus tau]